MSDKKYVTYEEFGAVGDGVTDDFAAIKKAHSYANEMGLPVKAHDGAHYYICDTTVDGIIGPALIKTNTDWGTAKFTIDDSGYDAFNEKTARIYYNHVFSVEPSAPFKRVERKDLPDDIKLEAGMTKINYAPGQDALIRPIYAGHKIYRRRGYWTISLGSNSSEIIKIDKDGNISPETPIMWNYASIDYIDVYYIDNEPLTVEGGTFITKASKNSVYKEINGVMTLRDNYVARALKVTRSNTTVKNVKHYVENEITLKEHSEKLIVGNTYMGFFVASCADSVSFVDCVLTAHRCYTKPSGWAGGGGTQGTYDFHAAFSNNVVLKNCRQSNFWVTVTPEGDIIPATKETIGAVSSMAREQVIKNPRFHDGKGALMHWGVGETDFCKNVEYYGCTLSRYDAHQGLYNGKIIDCEINIIALTGMGNMIIENTTQYSLDPSSVYNNLIHMRSDYGSTWDGEIKLKNHKAYLYTGASYVFMHTYVNWYMGYQCTYPTITLDNVQYFDIEEFIKTRKSLPFDKNIEIILNTGGHIKDEPNMHLPTTLNKPPYRQYCDYDGDGFVDNFEKFNSGEGYDFNGDGVINDEDKIYHVELLADRSPSSKKIDSGILDEKSRENLNPVKPPVHIKVLNNKAGLKYVVTKTAIEGAIDGGFFGKTKFYYSEDEYYLGTDYENTEAFNFQE